MDPTPPNMNTRPIIEMAITDIIKGIESTAATSTSVRKYNAISTITPGLARTHTVAQTTTVSGTMIPYTNRRAVAMAIDVLMPGWLRFITSFLYTARTICNQAQITGARYQRALWRGRNTRTRFRAFDIKTAGLKAVHQLVGSTVVPYLGATTVAPVRYATPTGKRRTRRAKRFVVHPPR